MPAAAVPHACDCSTGEGGSEGGREGGREKQDIIFEAGQAHLGVVDQLATDGPSVWHRPPCAVRGEARCGLGRTALSRPSPSATVAHSRERLGAPDCRPQSLVSGRVRAPAAARYLTQSRHLTMPHRDPRSVSNTCAKQERMHQRRLTQASQQNPVNQPTPLPPSHALACLPAPSPIGIPEGVVLPPHHVHQVLH